MTVELIRSGDQPGFADYDVLCQERHEVIFDTLSEIGETRANQIPYKIPLPYTPTFAGQNRAVSEYSKDFAELLLQASPVRARLPMQYSLLTGRAIAAQLEADEARPQRNATVSKKLRSTLQQYCEPGQYQTERLLHVTNRYRRIRPQLNKFIDYFVNMAVPAERYPDDYRAAGKIAASLVVLQSEEVAYLAYSQHEVENAREELDRISSTVDLDGIRGIESA